MLGRWQRRPWGARFLSGELGDLITKSDIVRQLKLVVLQLSRIMRASHQKMSAV